MPEGPACAEPDRGLAGQDSGHGPAGVWRPRHTRRAPAAPGMWHGSHTGTNAYRIHRDTGDILGITGTGMGPIFAT